MTDLIKRLRLQSEHIPVRTLFDDAADRIEELENSLAWYQMMDAMSSDHVVDLTDKLEAVEAKLSKTMEALRGILKGDDMYPWRIAREVLAELEKTK